MSEQDKSWWARVRPETDLDSANQQIGWMLEDWQKVGEALGFPSFVDPEVIIAEAQRLRAVDVNRPVAIKLELSTESLVERIKGDSKVLVEVMARRDVQDERWGGPEHDCEHTGADWVRFIDKQTSQIRMETLSDDGLETVDRDAYRDRLLDIAALAVAAIQAHDRVYGGVPDSVLAIERQDYIPQRDFGKAEFLDFLDAALPKSLRLSEFSLSYWAGISDTEDGATDWGRLNAAVREYQLGAIAGSVCEVALNHADGSISLRVQA